MTDTAANDLDSDIAFFDGLLASVIGRLEGPDCLSLIEHVRKSAQALRQEPSIEKARRLRDEIAALDLDSLRKLTRAFSIYFDLINLAEQRARLRTLRERAVARKEPIAESLEAAIQQLREAGVNAGQLQSFLKKAFVVPVFTAHPSEARRRTILEKLKVITQQMDLLEYSDLLPQEKEAAIAAMTEEVEAYWLSSLVRAERPTVQDEVRQGLSMIESLYDVVPRLYREFSTVLETNFAELKGQSLPAFLRFGSWIGGDRDGNPNVTHDVTLDAVRTQLSATLRLYISRVEELGRRLSLSDRCGKISPEFQEKLSSDLAQLPGVANSLQKEPFRAMCKVIAARLENTLEHVQDVSLEWTAEPPQTPVGIYQSPKELLNDLQTISRELKTIRAEGIAAGWLHDLTLLVEVFGFHTVTLDIRQNSARHGQALDEVFARAEICPSYLKLSPNERFDLLAEELSSHRPLIPTNLPYSRETQEVVQTFRSLSSLLERQCPQAVENYIISNATEPAHVLEVLLFAREAGLFRPQDSLSRLNIIPLFEAQAPLLNAVTIIQRVLMLPLYREHLKLRNNVQEVMIGYSDSNKETGVLQSAWCLYQAQRSLAEIQRRSGITVQMFHGRGGAIGRGGGPANRAILAQPTDTVSGRLRFTEQGEVIADRYGSVGLAARHLEQIGNAVLRSSFAVHADPPLPTWERLLERLAERACRHYRELVYEDPEFLTYFEEATPIAEIGKLKLASRPARRTETTVQSTEERLDKLRAIPWVFSWMQSRHTLPGWYGLGSAVCEYLSEHPEEKETLRTMYEQWPFWRTLIDSTQMILAKADLEIARLYADLVTDPSVGDRLYGLIADEYQRTVDVVCQITGKSELLDDMPVLQRSIARRNPYVDPLSFIQLALLRRLRAGEEPQEELLTGVLESINGIASGLKNTG